MYAASPELVHGRGGDVDSASLSAVLEPATLDAHPDGVGGAPETFARLLEREPARPVLSGTREVETLVAAACETLEQGAEQTQAMRVGRGVRQAERDRVRALLERDEPAGGIFQRAVELRDPESLAALRSELLWRGDASEQEVATLIAECDRGLATFSSGDEATENIAAVTLRESAAGFDELAELAIKAVSGRPTADERLRLAFAENADVA